MATKKRTAKKRKAKKRKAKGAQPTSTKKAYRVEYWFNGVRAESGVAKGTQNERPGWRPRGTYAKRALAAVHKKAIEKAEKVSTRIVPVAA